MPHSSGSGIITGIVSEDGAPKINTVVSVIDRTTNELVKQTFTGSSGEYSINNLNPDVSDYAVFAKDEDGAIRKNALMQDYVQPADGAIGSVYSYNWFKKLREFSPIILFAPIDYSSTEGFTAIHASSYGNINPVLGAGSVSLIAQTDILGTPDLKLASVVSGTISSTCGTYYDWSFPGVQGGSQRPTISCVWGVDTTTPQSFKFLGSAGYGILGIRLSASFVITVDRHYSTNTITALTYTIPAGAKRSGNHVIGLSIDFLGDMTLYLDGQQVATTSAYAAYQDPYAFSSAGGIPRYSMVIGADGNINGNTSPPAGTFKVFLGGAFDQFFTADQHLDIYNSLFVASKPVVTGYRKEVCTDTPSYYYPLDKFNQEIVYDGFTPPAPLLRRKQPIIGLLAHGSLPTAKKSPVIGYQASYFDGNTMYRSPKYVAGLLHAPLGFGRYDWGVEAWVNLASTPTVRGTIISHNNYTARYQTVSINSARKVEVLITATVVNTITFAQVLDLNTDYHIFVRVRKTAGVAELFINGTFSESIAISPTIATLASISAATTSFATAGNISIGGWSDLYEKVTDGFNGNLFGVAVYHRNLSDARIAAHYAARNVA